MSATQHPVRNHALFHIGLLLVLVALPGVVTPALAADDQPALPEAGRIALSKVVEKPGDAVWENGTATVNCQVLVSRRGRADGLKCGLFQPFDNGTADRLVAATYNGLRRARFLPARVDGEKVDVVMSVRVVVRCIGRRCKTSSYPNLGLFDDKYGIDYVAPQEIIDDRATWYERLLADDVCRSGRDVKAACVDEGMYRLNLYVDVDDQGEPGRVRYNRNPITTDAEVIMEAAQSKVQQVRYIPGTYQDAPTPMTTLTSSIHYTDNDLIPATICVEQQEVGWRLPQRTCYNPQEYARVTASLQIISWLPITGGD